MVDAPTVQLDFGADGFSAEPVAHQWWARRRRGVSTAVVLLAHDPQLASSEELLRRVRLDPLSLQEPDLTGVRMLDLCCGVGTATAAGQQLGASVTAVDNHPIAVLASRAGLTYPSQFTGSNVVLPGIGRRACWGGLQLEVTHWAAILRERLVRAAGDWWWGDREGWLCERAYRCPQCGIEATFNESGNYPTSFVRSRAFVECGRCGASTKFTELQQVGVVISGALDANFERRTVPSDLITDYRMITYPPEFESLLEQPWVVTRSRRVLFRDAQTPRQARLVRSMRQAFRSVRDELADRDYSPTHASAVLVYLALGLSGVLAAVTTAARWDSRRGRLRTLDRAEWMFGTDFVEIGGAMLDRLLRQRFTAISDTIAAANSSRLPADVRSGTMGNLDFGKDAFDIVVWDPPFYDNIDYERIAFPFSRFLRSLIGDLEPSLRWPTEADLLASTGRSDPAQYENQLREAAFEIERVLHTDGRLGLLWISNDTSDLGNILGIMQESGLELIQSVSFLETSKTSRAASQPFSVLLVFRKASRAQPANADVLLAGAVADRPMMYAGLVQLLQRELDPEELDDLVPDYYHGSFDHRLSEAVLSHPQPRHLLGRIPKGALRDFVESREEADASQNSREELVDRAFRVLGWQVPQILGYAVGSALDRAAQNLSALRLAQHRQQAESEAKEAFDQLESVLRFCVVAWASRVADQHWDDVIAELTERRTKLSLGHWHRAFTELPSRYASYDHLIGLANRGIRRSKVLPATQDVVAVRNRVIHPEDQDLDWAALREKAAAAIGRAIERLREADAFGALPQVLQPVSELRDPYGRITLRLVDHRQHHVEFLMTRQTDLTKPVVVLHSGTKPREVDPVCLPAEEITRRAGVSSRAMQ